MKILIMQFSLHPSLFQIFSSTPCSQTPEVCVPPKRWAGHVERMGEKMNAYRILVGKPEGKRPL
jgi:hypothetical protein